MNDLVGGHLETGLPKAAAYLRSSDLGNTILLLLVSSELEVGAATFSTACTTAFFSSTVFVVLVTSPSAPPTLLTSLGATGASGTPLRANALTAEASCI